MFKNGQAIGKIFIEGVEIKGIEPIRLPRFVKIRPYKLVLMQVGILCFLANFINRERRREIGKIFLEDIKNSKNNKK